MPAAPDICVGRSLVPGTTAAVKRSSPVLSVTCTLRMPTPVTFTARVSLAPQVTVRVSFRSVALASAVSPVLSISTNAADPPPQDIAAQPANKRAQGAEGVKEQARRIMASRVARSANAGAKFPSRERDARGEPRRSATEKTACSSSSSRAW